MSHNDSLGMLRCTDKNSEKQNVSAFLDWGDMKPWPVYFCSCALINKNTPRLKYAK
jgi:hypothetical protein